MKKIVKIIIGTATALCFLQSAFASENFNDKIVLEDLEKNRNLIKSKIINAKIKRDSIEFSCLQEKLLKIEKIINNFNKLSLGDVKNKSNTLMSESNYCSINNENTVNVSSSTTKMTVDYLLPEDKDAVISDTVVVSAIPMCASCIK